MFENYVGKDVSLTETLSTLINQEPVKHPDFFIGHKRIFNRICSSYKLDLSFPLNNYRICGEPRSGKTSLLLNLFSQKACLDGVSAPIYQVYLQFSSVNTIGFWQMLYSALENLVKKHLDLKAQKSGNAYLDFRNLLTDFLNNKSLPKFRVVFLLDDFDLISSHLKDEDLIRLRGVISNYLNQLALVISSTDPLDLVFSKFSREAASSLLNLLTSLYLDNWTKEEAQEYVSLIYKEGFGINPPVEECELLMNEAGTHPALLKIVCQHLIESNLGKSHSKILDFDTVTTDFRFDDRANWLFGILLSRRSEEQRNLIYLLAREEFKDETRFFEKLNSLYGMDLEDVKLNLRYLRNLGLIKPSALSLFSLAFRYWARKVEGIPFLSSELLVKGTKDKVEYFPNDRKIKIADRSYDLTPTENRLFAYLYERPNVVCEVSEILDTVWGGNKKISVVEKSINRLRKKIEKDPELPKIVINVHGKGYMFVN